MSADGTFEYEVEDYYEDVVKKGRIQSDGTSDKTIDLTGDLDVGYYEIVIYAQGTGTRLPVARTSISIVDDYEFETDRDTSMFGTNSHIGKTHPYYLTGLVGDEAKKLGVGNLREGYYWHTVEKTEGNPIVEDSSLIYSGYVNDIGMYMTGGFRNSIYMPNDELIAKSDKAMKAFANYADAVADAFNTRYPLKEFEVWNEYWAWDYSDEAIERYASLFDATYNVMNVEHPETKLITCFINRDTPIDQSWNENILKTNIAQQMDVATIHCYGGTQNSATEKRPEIASPVLVSVDNLRTLMEQYNAGDKEIWLTETGYATMPIDVYGNSIVPADGTNAKKYCVSEKDAGMYLPRLIMLGLSEGCERVYTYQLMDYNYEPANQDSFFGLLRGPETVCGVYSPKPMFSSYATLIRALDNTEFKALNINGSCYEFTFANDSKCVTAVYSIDGASTYTYETDKAVTVTDIMGRSVKMEPVNGAITLNIDGNVQYICENI